MQLIVATGLNGEIGKNNSLLWHLPEDLKHFKQITIGKNVIVGRKTYESIPASVIANGDRNWVIVSRNNDYNTQFIDAEIIVAGGSEIYKLFEDDVNTIYRTVVHQTYDDADTFYQIPSGFKMIECSKLLTGVNGLSYHHEMFKREVL